MFKNISFYILFILFFKIISAQYTTAINADRPSHSVSAFSVGTNILQIEAGLGQQQYKHSGYNNSTIRGQLLTMAVRYGWLAEQLEINLKVDYLDGKLTNNTVLNSSQRKINSFLNSEIGLKVLLYDPFIKKNEAVNFYSWRNNNLFQLENLIPAVSLTIGLNFSSGLNELLYTKNSYPYQNVFNILDNNVSLISVEEPYVSPKLILSTQSILMPELILTTNLIYDRIFAPYSIGSYIISLSYLLANNFSFYFENEGIKNQFYSDIIFRTGIAVLLSKNLQIDTSFTTNAKDTPFLIAVNFGAAYRFDFHKDVENPKSLKDIIEGNISRRN